ADQQNKSSGSYHHCNQNTDDERRNRMATGFDLFRSSALLRRSDAQPEEKFVHRSLSPDPGYLARRPPARYSANSPKKGGPIAAGESGDLSSNRRSKTPSGGVGPAGVWGSGPRVPTGRLVAEKAGRGAAAAPGEGRRMEA